MPEDSRLVTAGVTGTNGKTSTTTLLSAALSVMCPEDGPRAVDDTSTNAEAPHSIGPGVETSAGGAWVARVTTVGLSMGRIVEVDGSRRWQDEPQDVPMTHAGMLTLVDRLHARRGRHIALEYTSQALARGYAKLWPARVGVFTNLTHDHLDAHGSPEHYLASKAQLFVHLPRGGSAILHARDPSSELLAQVVPRGVRTVRYGATESPSAAHSTSPIDVRIETITPSWDGTEVELAWPTDVGLELARGRPPKSLFIRAIGTVFGENAVAALAAALALGARPEDVVAALAVVPAPPGRFEVVASRPYVVVDYAHTPDALARTLETARRLAGTGRLSVVFGAGGGRDQKKRPFMGLAARRADRVILTSDNPRNEAPASIAAQIAHGLQDLRFTGDDEGKSFAPSATGGGDTQAASPELTIELDRARAITLAIETALADEVIVIAGKGHERTQIFGDSTREFSDPDVVRLALAAKPRRP